jgi:hypothetical protein
MPCASQLGPAGADGIREQLGGHPVAHPVEHDQQHRARGCERRHDAVEHVLDTEEPVVERRVRHPLRQHPREAALLGFAAVVHGLHEAAQRGRQRRLGCSLAQRDASPIGIAAVAREASGGGAEICGRVVLDGEPARQAQGHLGRCADLMRQPVRVHRTDPRGDLRDVLLPVEVLVERGTELSEPLPQSAHEVVAVRGELFGLELREDAVCGLQRLELRGIHRRAQAPLRSLRPRARRARIEAPAAEAGLEPGSRRDQRGFLSGSDQHAAHKAER